ncbi:ribonuclease HII [Acinetobacter sp. ANC 4779]|uniref:ribonuclease HII n=1 Tax=Acinetobacter sp. ANC 4779 TaxID=2529848 RepID=UPI001038A1B4|nr:ribonuclease HII [Acinetobacter sp. ANC 4779]TCB51464.1 ribonuclease HII [Acinetobacter sp. ANC 4779]
MKIAGADEAGRGPLVGSVVAAAVILDPNNPIKGLNDSKKLTAKKREKLFIEIQEKALAWAIAEASHEEIDEINILQASLLAMRRAVEALNIQPEHVLVDGNKVPQGLMMSCDAVVGGDAIHAEISAASILAKVTRDHQMIELDLQYPQFGFAKHKGYPTKAHFEAIAQHGVIDQHRRSYAPVKKALALGEQN